MEGFETGLELVKASQARSVSYQRYEKVRTLLYAVAEMKKKRLASWSVADIVDFVMGIDKSREKVIGDQTLMMYYSAIKDCFKELSITIFYTQERALSCAMNLYRQERLKSINPCDRVKKPNLVREETWRRILMLVSSPIGRSEKDKAWNRVIGVCITWCLASGARLADVLNLKKEFMTEVAVNGDEECWTVDIMEGKSNRYGHRNSRVVLFEKPKNFIFCPIETFRNFYDRFPSLKGRFCISNPDNPNRKIKTSQIMTRLEHRCTYLGMAKDETPNAHSMRSYFVNHSLEQGVSVEKIAKSVNWSSTAMITHYIRNTEFLLDAPNRTIVNDSESQPQESFIPKTEESFHF